MGVVKMRTRYEMFGFSCRSTN